MPDTLSMLEVTTRRYIDTNPGLRDLVFNQDPTQALIGENCHEEVAGGSSWNADFMYDVQDGGPYSKGQDLPADNRQIEQQLRFDPKYNVAMITFFKEDIKVLNSGPLAVIKLVEERTNAAYEQLGAQAALQFYLPGQGTFFKFPNGAAEAISDGTTNGWDGNTYPVYGTITRTNAQYAGTRLLAPAPVTFANSQFSFVTLENMYQSVNFGSGSYEPNIIGTTAKGFGYIRSQYQTFQRLVTANISVGKIGFKGLEYNNATIVASRYVPGSYLTASGGTNDRVATRMITYATGGAVTGYPTGSLGTGESMWILNVRKPMIKYFTSANAPYNGSLDDDGFIPSAQNTKLVGKVLLAQNYVFLPGYHCYAYGFTS